VLKKKVEWVELEGEGRPQWVGQVPGGCLFKEMTSNGRIAICFIPAVPEAKKSEVKKSERVPTKSK